MKRLVLFACLVLTLAHTAVASAQSTRTQHPLLTDTLSVAVGAFVLDRDFKIDVAGSIDEAVPARKTDLTGAARLKAGDSTFALEARWRFGEKWSLWGQYFTTSEDASAELTEDVEWEDVVFGKGTGVGAGFDIDVARLYLGRVFSQGERHEFGAGLGVHWLEVGAYIQGKAIIDGEEIADYRGSVSAGAPLPNIGAWYAYAFSPRWALQSRIDWFGASYDEYSGSFWNAAAGINYTPFQHLGVSLSYNYIELDLDVDKSDWRGGVDVTISGPFLSVTTFW